MLTRCIRVLIALAVMPITLQAGLQDGERREPDSQQEKKSLRLLVEGERSAIPAVVEEMRRWAREYGLKITFVSKLADPYDVRIILASGTGQTWDTNPNTRPGDIRFPVTFAFSTAVALAPEGRTVFTVAESGITPKSANIAVARELIKNLQTNNGALKKKQDMPDDGEGRAQEPSALAKATISSSSATEEPPAEPGVYYKASTGWVRLEEASAAGVKTKGMGTTLLTGGISGVRISEVYPGAQASLRISERKPTFYVRGFAVSDKDVAIVRLEKKADHREAAIASISPFYAKAGYRERDIRKLKIARASGDVTVITLESELEPGEYMLSLAKFELGYDFQIAER